MPLNNINQRCNRDSKLLLLEVVIEGRSDALLVKICVQEYSA